MSGLLGFLQGASNAAASNVSGPIDLINAGLLGIGMPMPAAPFGGSQWMRERGLTREPQNRTAGLLGEAAGMSLPIVAAAKAPQIAQGLLQMGDNLRAPNPMNAATRGQAGAIVYHGSPHKFDQFDASKIGTGEGAQAYGHGLYFAESPDVARSYQTALSDDAFIKPNGVKVVPKPGSPADVALAHLASVPPDANKFAYAKRMVRSTRDGHPDQALYDKVEKAIDTLWMKDVKIGPSGNLYKVDLPDEHIAKMLDWDKPLSQQSEGVRRALAPIVEKNKAFTADPSWGDLGNPALYEQITPGRELYQSLGRPGEAADRLRALGIPGLRYLDGMSRGKGGTSNYVVFPGNEGLLKILGRE